MSDAPLNLDGVQFALARREVDPQFRALVDQLDIAYYQNWKTGKPFDFHGFDPISNPAQGDPKEVFDKLHGDIWAQHAAALIEMNDKLGGPYSVDKIDPVQGDGRRKSAALTDRIASARIQVTTGSANIAALVADKSA